MAQTRKLKRCHTLIRKQPKRNVRPSGPPQSPTTASSLWGDWLKPRVKEQSVRFNVPDEISMYKIQEVYLTPDNAKYNFKTTPLFMDRRGSKWYTHNQTGYSDKIILFLSNLHCSLWTWNFFMRNQSSSPKIANKIVNSR